jgi:cyclophilin family peptidyl-prolyl cis-trans isomerase
MKTNHLVYFVAFIFTAFVFSDCSSAKKDKVRFVEIETSLGVIKVRLNNETPLHRDNFLKLVKENVYDGLCFHRVIHEFMIQAGDPLMAVHTKSKKDSVDLGYLVPAEFVPGLFHKKGALAAARMGDNVNPEQASSSSQFYIVHGRVLTDEELEQLEERINNMKKQSIFFKNINEEKEKAFNQDEPLDYGKIQQAAALRTEEQLKEFIPYKIPADQWQVYKTIGGVPHLDGSYTVFGEVVEGLDVVDRIATAETDKSDRPVEDIIIIKMKIVRR